MKFNLAVLPGDGIGPEVITEGIKVLQAVGKRFGHNFNLHYGLVGGVAIDQTGTALTRRYLEDVPGLLMRYCLVRWVAPSGMTPRLRFVLKMVCWHCERGWGCLPTCARSRFSRCWLTPPI